ncbi:MAG: hypothetical protein C5B53_12025 [Candidatus Melainabacteria bacterium]|nr:MAG: hypothetical protein C5B53_12025 [Candidatus Melainabacteria bacterium]
MSSISIPPSIRLPREQPLPLPTGEKRRSENSIVALSFAFCLIFFFANSTFNCLCDTPILVDYPEAAKFPQVTDIWANLSSITSSFEKYFNDRFAFRDRLIGARTLLDLKLFRVTGSTKVIFGKNGYFYYADNANRRMIEGTRPFTPKQLEAWKALLERRYNWCKEHGIDYYFVLAPTKSSIYPEYLPDPYQHSFRKTRTDTLLDFLKQTQSPVHVVDLRPSVREAKGSLPLFLLTDLHWNQLGSYYGYKSLIDSVRTLHPAIGAPTDLSEFDLRPLHYVKGDLSRMLGVLGIITETNLEVRPKHRSKINLIRDKNYTENKYGLEGTRAFGFHQNGSCLPSAVMFRDSFSCYMIDLYLPKHFSRISFFWQPEFNESIVLREKPNIVLQESVECSLYSPLPEN